VLLPSFLLSGAASGSRRTNGMATVASAPPQKSIPSSSTALPPISLPWRSRTTPCSASNHSMIYRHWTPTGEQEFILSCKESTLDRPILRKCTKEKGIIEEIMHKSVFLRIFRAMMQKAGYFCRTSIHTVRWHLGKRIDGQSRFLKPLLASTSLRPAAFAPINWPTLRSRVIY
jgi:hypothetical protein